MPDCARLAWRGLFAMKATFTILAAVLFTTPVSHLFASDQAFFPSNAFAEDLKWHQFVEDWYSKHLRAMR
jgi:hypothetical protein